MNTNGFRWLLVRRALFQKRAKSLLILLAVAMGASVVSALLNLEADLRQRVNRELRDYGPNVVLMPDPSTQAVYLNPDVLEALKSEPSVVAFTPQLLVPVHINGASSVLVGANLDALRKLYPGWDWTAGNGIFVGARLARKLSLDPEESFDLKSSGHEQSVKSIGFLESGEAEDDHLFGPLEYAQKIADAPGRFQIVSISALGDAHVVESTFTKMMQSYPGVKLQVIRRIADAETLILDKISRLMSLVIAIIFVILFFCINTTVSAILLARQSEIALMRALGARRKQIMSGLTLELIALAVAGGIVGYVAGIGMAQVLGKVLFRTWVVPRAGVFLITLFSSLVMMVISSILPIQRAINRDAAVILKEA